MMMYVVALGLALQFLGFIFLVSVLIVVAQVVGSRYQDHPRRAPLTIIPKKGTMVTLIGLTLLGVGRFLAS